MLGQDKVVKIGLYFFQLLRCWIPVCPSQQADYDDDDDGSNFEYFR